MIYHPIHIFQELNMYYLPILICIKPNPAGCAKLIRVESGETPDPKGGEKMDKAKIKAQNDSWPMHANSDSKHLAGLFDEMLALMAVMPGVANDPGVQISTEEETEAMFDNMPV
ncbi:hypothetical protein [Pseudorhodobacter wandonensis]|uniref:hypothetical protein n=1 Tax=Pseudorhodobacter wandonensis TaxID=1120568 RepID=UPI0018CE8CA4|nr:hypothetical protein [Pseudorhodobacter wandonensis]